MSAVENREVLADEEGMRLDRWFRQHFPGVGQGQLQKMLRKGQVRIDGRRAKTADRVQPGQVIRVPPLQDAKLTKNSVKKTHPDVSDRDRALLESWVLHRDQHVIVLNKPAGLAVQGGTGTKRHLDGMLDGLREDGGDRPRLVHRIDKDTSGILVLARTATAARKLTAAFKSKDTQKLYWAAVVGNPSPESGRVNMALSKSVTDLRANGREQVIVDEDNGKHAVTYYETLERAGREVAWVALYPVTGRTHQLRVHMAEINTPILGDGKYGGEASFPAIDGMVDQLHLHARAIRIPNPGGGWLELTAPLPPHMKKTWKLLGFDPPNKDDAVQWPDL